jgi:hypothetical protein
MSIRTGNVIPTLSEFKYTYKDNTLQIKYIFNDPDQAISFVTLFVGDDDYDIDLEKNVLIVKNVKDFKAEDVKITVVYELNSSSNGTQTVIYSSPEEIVETPSQEPEQPTDVPKKSKCSSGTYFISTVLLMSLCGVLINKRK